MKKNEIDTYIETELKKFKFNRTSLGYKYIKRGLNLGIKKIVLVNNLTKGLYKQISICESVEVKNIKWNIEKAIKYMYLNTDTTIIERYFSIDVNQLLTPKLFFIVIIDNYFLK